MLLLLLLQEQLQSVHVKAFWQQLVSAQQQQGGLLRVLLPALQVRV